MENLFLILLLVGLSIISWVVALKGAVRRKMNQSYYDFLKVGKEGREMHDAATLAVSLVLALFFSITALVALVVATAGWFNS